MLAKFDVLKTFPTLKKFLIHYIKFESDQLYETRMFY